MLRNSSKTFKQLIKSTKSFNNSSNIIKNGNNSLISNVSAARQYSTATTTTNVNSNVTEQIKKIQEFTTKNPSISKTSSTNTHVSFGTSATDYTRGVKITENKQIVLVKIGGGVIEDDISNLINSLNFLKKIGLFPVVVHGGGPQLNAELEAAGEPTEYVEGIRVTPPSVLAIAQRVFMRENLKIVEALESSGTKARPITQGVFQAVPLDPKLYGFVGDVTKIFTDSLASCIASDYVPVLSSLAMTEHGQVMNVNADIAALELAKAINPLKIVFINTTAGMKDGDGKVMQHIKLDEQYDELMKQPWVKYGTKLKLRVFKSTLDVLPPSTSITLTSPALLVKELFAKHGSGTTVERGEVMLSNESPTFNEQLFLHLLEKSTGLKKRINFKKLQDDLKKGTIKTFANSHYSAGLIMRPLSSGSPISLIEQFFFSDKSQTNMENSEYVFKKLFEKNSYIWKGKTGDQWFKKIATGFSELDNGESVYWVNIPFNQVESLVKQISGTAQSKDYLSSIKLDSSSNLLRNKNDKRRIGLIGARGFTGGHLVRLITNHPEIELALASSSTNFGKPITTEFPTIKSNLNFENVKPENIDKFTTEHGIDGWFLALPDKISAPYIGTLDQTNLSPVLVDLSSDHRFDDLWTYGSPETNRENIKKSTMIANPGCYATGMYLTLKPFVDDLLSTPTCFGISGYSGAGSKPSDKNDTNRLSNNILPYSLTNHTHEREVSHQLGTPIFFSPHVGQFFQGITLTISMQLKTPMTKEQVYKRYMDHYKNEPLVKIEKDIIPEVKNNSSKHTLTIGGFSVQGNHLVVVTTLDNLLKGAATQALQNMNLCLGLNELSGIENELK
ncbi:hypothetical protein CYY_007234 [Polysphondylium violaceum]|uniref:acetylglutamate kinase n=1 Tax=Polysphondylium violaceum TaxID=133409 RepID=A0A8J4PNY6_9MYCE|nr:hypothetical protein CYY_007234 [Polysphondylium violaceum]